MRGGGARRAALRGCLKSVLAGLAIALGAGCATTGADPRDPFEPYNRAMHRFNEEFDDAIAKPVATGYRNVVPEPLRDRVRNFFSNIADLFIGANNFLQGKPEEGVNDWLRFLFNTTFGLLGIHDIATEMGIEKHNEDFGQTFGRWGVANGPYLVWPFLGPSTLRDSAGLVFDYGLDPVGRHATVDERNSMIALRALGQRADLLDAVSLLEQAALDKYVFLRDAYLQRRRSLVYDGSPPREKIAPAENGKEGDARER